MSDPVKVRKPRHDLQAEGDHGGRVDRRAPEVELGRPHEAGRERAERVRQRGPLRDGSHRYQQPERDAPSAIPATIAIAIQR